jgi:hypothetical protein
MADPYPQADENGAGGFRLGKHVEPYRPPFRQQPGLTLRYVIDGDTRERYVRWEARIARIDQSGPGSSQSGAFPFELTGLPWPYRT